MAQRVPGQQPGTLRCCSWQGLPGLGNSQIFPCWVKGAWLSWLDRKGRKAEQSSAKSVLSDTWPELRTAILPGPHLSAWCIWRLLEPRPTGFQSSSTIPKRTDLQWFGPWNVSDPPARLWKVQLLLTPCWSREQGWAAWTGTHSLDFGSWLHHNGIKEAFRSCYILISALKWRGCISAWKSC